MNCCITTLIPFVNATTTNVPYSGNKPTVTVSYLIGGIWQALGIATVQQIDNSEVMVDHGGVMTGVIKFVQ